jgi:HEAT repeat protein
MPATAPSPLVQALLNAVQQEDTAVIDTAVTAIIHAKETETAVTHLGPLLLDEHTETAVRHRIVQAFTQLDSPTAVPYLGQSLTEDTDPGTRLLCIAPLERIDPISGIPYFQTALHDPDNAVREAARTALGTAVQQIIAILQRDPADDIQTAALNALNGITLDNLEKLLRMPAPANTGDMSIPEAASTALGLRGGAEATNILCRFLHDRQQQLHAEELGSLEDAGANRAQETAEERVMISAVNALRDIGSPATLPCLEDAMRHNLNFRVRRLAVSALGRHQNRETAAALLHVLLNDADPRVRNVAHKRLSEFADWRLKTRQLLAVLHAGSQTRADIDAPALISAIKPPPEEMGENPNLLTDFLIEQAPANVQNERMTALLAELTIACANSSMTLAAERIAAVQAQSHLPPEQLRPLRVEGGGSKALDPILRQLEENLEKNFQQPIAELNRRTRRIWRQTIIIAQIGFVLRALMSVALFAIGAYLVLDSYQRFAAGSLDATQFLGPGVSFVTGLGTMFTMVIKGPLREIRKAVNDVGVATAVFIAYVHRILQISHTFSYYYLHQEITFERLKETSDLIEDTMQDTVSVLQQKPKIED